VLWFVSALIASWISTLGGALMIQFTSHPMLSSPANT
jgi:hypothetical protein